MTRRGAIRDAAGLIVASAGALAALPTAYLGVVTLAGLPRRPRAGDDTSTRFVVLVPAHDEEAGIGRALDALATLDYPADRFAVHVVADNCTDGTLDVVAASVAEGHDRVAPDEPGKGPALNWLLDRLVARGDEFDAIVIVDADTTVDPVFLRRMSAAITDGAVALQGHYSVRDADASPAASFRWAALACRHHLRPLGRSRLGASCGLYGNGMVFVRSLAAGRRWSGHLVEDAEYQMELLLDGYDVTYVPDAVVLAEMPTTLDQATSQNERWERGRIDLVERFVPELLRQLPRRRGRRVQYADAVADHLVPPISALLVGHVAVTGLAAAAAWVGVPGARFTARTHGVAAAVVVGHVAAGLYSVRAPRHHVVALLRAPNIVLWKVRLWWSMLGREEVTWTRTERNPSAEAMP